MKQQLIQSIIVEDEIPSRQAMAAYLKDFCPDVEVVDTCDSVKTAYQSILKHRPQLVFLDIEMPNGNGFDLLQMFKTLSFKVIFVTAFSEYAIRAFRFAAVDYLLKPVKVDELVEAVERVKIELQKAHSNDNLDILLNTVKLGFEDNNQLVLRDTKGFTVLKINELIMCEAESYCTQFYLTGNRKITSGKSLGYYEELFSGRQMLKVHRSYMVNPNFVKSYSRQGEIFLDENHSCPLGNNYKQRFMDLFKS